jgi:hypothetical protein
VELPYPFDVDAPTDISWYGNKFEPTGEVHKNFTVGACDLESVHHRHITRKLLNQAPRPFLIRGLMLNWTAPHQWERGQLLRNHADEPYWLYPTGHVTLGELMKRKGRYIIAHAIYPPGSCYHNRWEPYSPMPFGALKDDFHVPPYFGPISKLNIAFGNGLGIGVPYENHPASWWAAVKGSKRWVFRPPEAASSNSGSPGTEPATSLARLNDSLGVCQPKYKPIDALHCDQQEGEVMWVPDDWWHETCSLDTFTMGIGGVGYDGCCPQDERHKDYTCGHAEALSKAPEKSKAQYPYSVKDIPSCASGERECGGLPFPMHVSLESEKNSTGEQQWCYGEFKATGWIDCKLPHAGEEGEDGEDDEDEDDEDEDDENEAAKSVAKAKAKAEEASAAEL